MAALDPNSVTAIATSVYGAATLILVVQIWRDRVQRERHSKNADDTRQLNELRSAFYEAAGYWEGRHGSTGSHIDASHLGRIFEALIRFECQLRLHGYKVEANDLGFAVRANFHDTGTQISRAGVALGLLPKEYRQTKATGLTADQP